MPRKLRMDTWSREHLESGILILVSVIIGGLILFYIVQANPFSLVESRNVDYIITSQGEFDKALSNSKPVAIMFSSDTCPVCQQMEPYWSKLARNPDLPIRFYVVKLSKETIDIYVNNGVEETPTFIVYLNGKPVARHVGSFTGNNITNVMYEWATSSSGLSENVFVRMQETCTECHTLPRSLNNEDLREWVYSSNDTIANLLRRSLEEGVPPSQYVGGKSALVNIILSMVPNLSVTEAEQMASMLDGITATIQTGLTGEKVELQESSYNLGAIASVSTALIAGLIAAFSPCVFPVLLAYLSMLVSREGTPNLGAGTSVKAGIATAAGALMIGGLFLVLGSIATSVNRILLPTAALILLSAGILGVLGVPTFINIGVSTKRGIVGFSFLYGLLAVQCSFPLVVGALILIAGSELTVGLLTLASFTLGISVPIALAVWATGNEKVMATLNKMAGKKAQQYSYGLLSIMGLILLLYSLNIIIID
ncbi:MAG: thioredoxin domain-containing protein [Desulfurococcales archaeon]|nr:thioredoxin domain-containing protein [Desulfurococcales archaeon]